MTVKVRQVGTTDEPVARSKALLVAMSAAYPIVISSSLAAILHFHQFEYIHQGIPNFLSKFVPEGKIPLALLGIQFVFTYYLTVALAVFCRATFSAEGYDNNHPRLDKHKMVGFAARIQAAHENSLENFPAFASAVIVGTLCEVPQDKLIYLARLGHLITYAINASTARSLLFNVGSASVALIYLFSVVDGFEAHFEYLCKLVLATPF